MTHGPHACKCYLKADRGEVITADGRTLQTNHTSTGHAELPLVDGTDADAKRTEEQEMDHLQVELALIIHRLKQLRAQYAGKEAVQRFYNDRKTARALPKQVRMRRKQTLKLTVLLARDAVRLMCATGLVCAFTGSDGWGAQAASVELGGLEAVAKNVHDSVKYDGLRDEFTFRLS